MMDFIIFMLKPEEKRTVTNPESRESL